MEFIVFIVRKTKKQFWVCFLSRVTKNLLDTKHCDPCEVTFLKLEASYICFSLGKLKLMPDKLMKREKEDSYKKLYAADDGCVVWCWFFGFFFTQVLWDCCESKIIRVDHLHQIQLLLDNISLSSLCSNSSYLIKS